MLEAIVTSQDAYGGSHDVPIAELSWRPSAYGIVIQDKKLLLSPQFSENKFDLPGGGVDLGESLEAAVIREVKEETGLDVASPEIIYATSRFFTYGLEEQKIRHIQSIMIYYTCNLLGGELSTDGFDEYEKNYARMAEWVPLSRLDSIEVASTYDWRSLVRKVVEAQSS
jgi:8-oxo-dGTP diphosphatase